MVERRARIDELCESGALGPHPLPRELHFIGDLASRNLTICLAPKTGTTSLSDFMLGSIDPGDQVDFLTRWHLLSGPDQRMVVESKTTIRAIIVRNPIDHLVSVFRYFFHNRNGYLEGVEELEQEVLARLHPDTTRKPLEFTDFLTFLLADELSSLRSRLPWLTSMCRPFSDFCSVCSYLPEVVVRLESITEEMAFLVEWSGLGRTYGRFPTFPTRNTNPANGREKVEGMARGLPRDIIHMLNRRYRADFFIGGYQPL